MSLRTQAEADLSMMIEDLSGFGCPVVLTSPAGLQSIGLVGLSTDISQMIDPDTGQLVSGRAASVALRISTLRAQGFTDLPRGVASPSSRPWVVTFDDIGGVPHTFKVQSSNPDLAAGVVTCILEAYR